MVAPRDPHGPEPIDLATLNAAIDQLTPPDPTITGAGLSRTDVGNAERLALYHGDDLRYAHDADRWYAWDGRRWRECTQGELLEYAVRSAARIQQEARHVQEDDRATHANFAQQSLSSRAISAALMLARGQQRLWTLLETMDTHPAMLNVENCTITQMRTGDWHPHRREDMNTWLCPTSWVQGATSKLLDRFTARFLPDEHEREYVLNCLAVAALSHGNSARKLVLLLGPTSTGKSTLTELLKVTLGPSYVASVNPSVFRGNLDDKPRPDLLRALHSRLLLAFEASDSWELHTDAIKRMTGGDPITARAMRSDLMVEQTAPFTPVIVANDVPRIKGADNAVRARLMVLLMDAPASELDNGESRAALIGDVTARQALLADLIRRYRELDGRMPTDVPQRFAEATLNVFAQLDDVDSALQGLREEGTLLRADSTWSPAQCASVLHLYWCYQVFVRKHGTPVDVREMLGQKAFAQRLRSLGYEIVRSDGSRVLGWRLGNTLTYITARA